MLERGLCARSAMEKRRYLSRAQRRHPFVQDATVGDISMSDIPTITSAEEEAALEAAGTDIVEAELEVEDWEREKTKMYATIFFNSLIIVILTVGTILLRTSAQDLSSRFMSLLEIVIGAIFGITATQITSASA